MGFEIHDEQSVDQRIATRLKALRLERGWSLNQLAERSSVSRATLSRLENAEVSATANVLGRLCAAYGLTLSRLMVMIENDFVPLIRPVDQPLWMDPETGYRRRSLSPPAQTLAGEVLECRLQPGTRISYDAPPKPGLEHHLIMRAGRLTISIGDDTHDLQAGDCLRYQLFGSNVFSTPDDEGAEYLLFIV